MAAGECINPRKVMPKAYKAVYWRLSLFFIVGALCVGIVAPANSEELAAAYSDHASNAASSPYVVNMQQLNIPVLPRIVNALLLTSCISAGNGYFFCATRSLYGMALAGKAPKIFTRTLANGIPIYCVTAVTCIGLLSYLQVSKGSAVVLSWFVSLATSGMLVNYAASCLTYLKFREARIAQNVPLDQLPFKSWYQPYLGYYALFWTTLMAFIAGYGVLLNGNWDVPSFLFSYFMIALFAVVFTVWKVIKKTKFVKPEEADLQTGMDEILAHESTLTEEDSPVSIVGKTKGLFGRNKA